MEDCNLTDREFKIAVMKKLNKLHENSGGQFSELRNKINEQKKYFTKDIKSLKENQTEVLELKMSINEMKNALESTGNRADHMEERISELGNKDLEMIQVGVERELRFFKK